MEHAAMEKHEARRTKDEGRLRASPGTRAASPRSSVLRTPSFVLAALAACAACAIDFAWTPRLDRAEPVEIDLYRGETLRLLPQLPTNVVAESLHWQTNGMGSLWWSVPGTVFAPANDCGAPRYRFFVRCRDAAGVAYRANGALRMLDSPGERPGELPLPVQSIDFGAVAVTNAPWALPSEVDASIAAATNAIPRPDMGEYVRKSGTVMNQFAKLSWPDDAVVIDDVDGIQLRNNLQLNIWEGGLLIGETFLTNGVVWGDSTLVMSGGASAKFVHVRDSMEETVYGPFDIGRRVGSGGWYYIGLPDREGRLALLSDIPAVVAPSTAAADAGKAADAKATGDALADKRGYYDLTYREPTTTTLPFGIDYWLMGGVQHYSWDATRGDWHNDGSQGQPGLGCVKGSYADGTWTFAWYADDEATSLIRSWEGFSSDGIPSVVAHFPDDALALVSQIPSITGKADKVTGATAGDFAALDANGNLTDSGKKASDFALASDRNMLFYASGTILAPETAVYRSALNADGTFPTVDATAIPTAAAYYQFELELAVPATVPSTITGPSGWTWIDGLGLPDPADLSGGETIYVSVRLDCTARTFLASVWRVE